MDATLGGYWNYEGIQLQQDNRDPRIIKVQDAGVPTYNELVFVANQDGDTNGFYRIRFTLPILSSNVDIRGKLLYNPGWEQERESLGKAYEPQIKQSQFRLFYERKRGRITFTEGIRKAIVAPVVSGHGGKAAALPGVQKPAAAEKTEGKEEKKDEDLFKGFGFQ